MERRSVVTCEEWPVVSAGEVVGSLVASLPDAELLGLEARGAGMVATVAYGGERWRIQLDALRDRSSDDAVSV